MDTYHNRFVKSFRTKTHGNQEFFALIRVFLWFIILSLFHAFWNNSVSAQNDAISNLKQQIEEGNSKAILEVLSEPYKAQDAQLKPFLRKLASDEKQRVIYDSPSYYAQIALAKLGEQDEIEQIYSEVDVKDSGYLVGMKKLFLVGGKTAIKKFYLLLDDNTQVEIKKDYSKPEVPVNDVFYYPKSTMAIYYLSKLVDNPPTRSGVPSNKVSLWKEWFEKHKELIQ